MCIRDSDLTCAELLTFYRPLNRIDTSRGSPTVCHNLIPRGRTIFEVHYVLSFSTSALRLQSMAKTMHCEPTASAVLFMNCGFSTAAVFTAILSAPNRNVWMTSFRVRTPPPTQNGMNTLSL